MKQTVVILLGCVGCLGAAPVADRSAWQWQAPVDVGRAGLVRLELSLPVLDASRPDLGDLRVVSPTGVETAWLMEIPLHDEGLVRTAAGFKVELAGKTTVIEVAASTTAVIEALEFDTPAREFLKSVTIEGRQGGGEWRNLVTRQVIFRQSGGAERLRVPVPAAVWEGFRCTVDDTRAQPVPFTGVRVVTAGNKPETVESPVVMGAREEVAGETRLTLDLGARNLNVAELCLEIPDAVFSRTCGLAIATPAADGATRMEPLASQVLYRVTGEQEVTAEHLVIAVGKRLSNRYLTATFRNGDSPPLKITGAKVRCYPTVLAFHADSAGAWSLLTGNCGVKAPAYDLAPLRGALAAAGGQRIVPGALQRKPDYQEPPALPGVEPAGAGIDLTEWCRRRAVRAVAPGVIRIELDALALAGCRTDLGDLRLVIDGRQIPYLIKPGTVTRELKPDSVVLRPDPQRPTVSAWEITLPVAGLPTLDLTASSAAPMFVRRFVAIIKGKDDLGNAWSDNAGTAEWTKTAGADSHLLLGLGGRRMPRTFVLETDHGDNPPLAVDDVRVRYAAPSITAKLAGGEPLWLYYGNAKAAPPQYDLRLVRNELLAAAPQAAGLGEEELLKPESRPRGGANAGSPWLWLALAGVVAALLVIVAKLLPRPAVG